MPVRLLHRLIAIGRAAAQSLRLRPSAITRPTVVPLALVAENGFLRDQLAVLHRSVKRPRCTPADRALLVLLAGRVRARRRALLIVQPATLLRWHQQLFRAIWTMLQRVAVATR